jgi:hypothetical protein
MNFADIEVGKRYRLIDIGKVGKPGNLVGLTLESRYVIIDKIPPDSVKIVNDNGNFAWVKAFRFERPFAAHFPQHPVIRGMDVDQMWIDEIPQRAPAPAIAPFEWKVGAKLHLKKKDADWFHDNPAANNPGWCEEMEELLGQEVTIRKFAGGNDKWVKLIECGEDYSYAKEWFVEFDGQEVVAPVVKKPIQPKFKNGDIVVIQDGVFDKKDRWIKDMDGTFGDVTVVIAADNGWFACDNGYSYPAEAFRIPNEEEKKLAIGALLRKAQADNIPLAKAKAGGVSSFTIWFEKDGKIDKKDIFAGICHAGLSYSAYKEDGKIVGVTDYLFPYETQVAKDQHADYKAFVDYVINRSPWHSFWKKSSVDRALKEGLQLKADVPAMQVASACVALRMGKEFAANKLPIFTMLVNAGYEEAVAWVLMQMFHKNGEKIQQVPPTGAHTVISTDTQIGPLMHLMRYGYDDKAMSRPKFSEDQKYRGYTAQINEQPNPLKNYDMVIDFMRTNAKGTSKGTGFDKITLWTEKDVFACADILTNMLHKLDVME